MITFALQLLVAHIIGDFVFQPKKWVDDKNKKKIRSKYLYYHIAVHALALMVMLRFDWSYWPAMLTILVTHFIIDLLKLYFTNKKNERFLFVLDQVLHLSVIAAVVIYYYPTSIDLADFYQAKNLLLIAALVGVTQVAAIVMQVLMSGWKPEEEDSRKSLKNAGKYIGILERLFVFAFIVLGQWQGIGFLITAKSVFRFGDLSRAKDRQLTEYILIGTLLSFGMAISVGLGYIYAIEHWTF